MASEAKLCTAKAGSCPISLNQWLFFIIVVLVVLLAIYFLFFAQSRPKPIAWVPLSADTVGSMTGFDWDTDEQVHVFRPWSGKGTGMAEYFGVIQYKPNQGKLLKVDIPAPTPLYWEYDVYRYPSWEPVYSVPLRQTAIFGGKEFPLGTGSYFIALRTVGELPKGWLESESAGVTWVTKDELPPRGAPPVEGLLVNDEDRYAEVAKRLQVEAATLQREGYELVATHKSVEYLLMPHTNLIHGEQMVFGMEPDQVALLVYPRRDAPSLLHVADEYEPPVYPTATMPINVSRFTFPYQTMLTIKERTFNVNTESAFLPLYAYIFARKRLDFYG
ncbi:Hypothetical protein POVN_LOCUS372 [uncultured virus]|nr:Hypothetical protein POVN_LOCUS372 [uncultured virus]